MAESPKPKTPEKRSGPPKQSPSTPKQGGKSALRPFGNEKPGYFPGIAESAKNEMEKQDILYACQVMGQYLLFKKSELDFLKWLEDFVSRESDRKACLDYIKNWWETAEKCIDKNIQQLSQATPTSTAGAQNRMRETEHSESLEEVRDGAENLSLNKSKSEQESAETQATAEYAKEMAKDAHRRLDKSSNDPDLR